MAFVHILNALMYKADLISQNISFHIFITLCCTDFRLDEEVGMKWRCLIFENTVFNIELRAAAE